MESKKKVKHRRRNRLTNLVAAVAASFLFAGSGQGAGIELTPCCADSSRQVRPFAEPYQGPLIDAHAHISGGVPPESYLELMADVVNQGTIDGLILIPAPNSGKSKDHEGRFKAAQSLAKQAPGRVRMICGANYINFWMFQASRKGYGADEMRGLSQRLLKDLESDECLGYGEIAIRHYDKYAIDDARGPQPVLVVPFDFAPMHEFFTIANGTGKPIYLHSEPMTQRGVSYESAWIKEVERLAEKYRKSVLILSHTAMTRPENLRKIMVRYANVYSDIKMIKQNQGWTNLEPPNEKGSKRLYEDWAKLFEDMPQRFMVGTDYKFYKTKGNLQRKGVAQYKELIGHYRKALGSISREAAELIAHKNARRIFGF